MVEIGVRSTKFAVSVALVAAVVGVGLVEGVVHTGAASGSTVPVRVGAALTGGPSWLADSAWRTGTAGSHTANGSAGARAGTSPVTTPSTAPPVTVPVAAPPVAVAASASAPTAGAGPAASGTPSAAPLPAVATPTTPTPEMSAAAVADLVTEVEATGIDPGPTWSWTMGDTATQCGAIPGNVATGCTFGAAGSARTVLSGSPSLALVAHELANAEVENDAVPSLMADVTSAEAGTSWTPIDAAASCLVEHFMGFQDHAAGAWECPAALADFVAANIHD